jgi:hypothetical protein
MLLFGATSVRPRTVSPSLHPCPPSEGLRASSRLAPRAPRDLATSRYERRGDAYDRLLPPDRNRTAVCRTFLARSNRFRDSGCSRAIRGRRACMTRGAGVFTTPGPLRPRCSNAVPRAFPPRGFRSRAWACSTHGARCIETSDTPVATACDLHGHAPSRVLVRVRLLLSEIARGWEDRGCRRGHLHRRFVKTADLR